MVKLEIASTRIKKIKKLFYLSMNLIHEWGFRYFVTVAWFELRRQKWKIFFPDAEIKISLEPRMPVNDIKNYQNFNQKNLTQKNEIETIEKKSNFKPKFTILVNYNKNNLELVLNSIQKQVYTNYRIVLVSNDEQVKNNLSDNFQDVKVISNISEFLKNFEDDYLCILDKNTTITEDTLFKIFKFLNVNDNAEVIYTDNDFFEQKISSRVSPFFKPDWSPYLLRSMNYLGPLCIIKKAILKKANLDQISTILPFYDIILRTTEISKNIMHIHIPLATIYEKSVYIEYYEEGKKIISDHLQRTKISGVVSKGILSNTFRVKYNHKSKPLISILIPTRNNEKTLKKCIKSLEKNNTYENWELIIIDNNSDNEKTKLYYESLPYKIVSYNDLFNFSKMNNLAVKHAKGDLLLFLNDDTKIIDSDSLEEMVSICCQDNIGAVGAKLIHYDDTIQHAGMVFLDNGVGFHPFQRISEKKGGYHNLINSIRECSAVTGACLLTKKKIFEEVNQFDEKFDVYYGDSDLCLKIINAGYKIIYTPYAKLLHDGSYSIKKQAKVYFSVENHNTFISKWPYLKNGDPFYNTNLGWNYSLKSIK